MAEVAWILTSAPLAFQIAVHRIQMLFALTPLARINANASPATVGQ
jgi:hypothetical protein